ncbi:hypothetical protein Q1695_009260 [Nippostrongylus brasiliensis]|nr:hypothetical protein Q1695_009260 [Nippostrongylus brasiliensis]
MDPDSSEVKYVLVDSIKFFSAIRTKGSRTSVDKPKILKLLEEAEAKNKKKTRKLEQEVERLRKELQQLRDSKPSEIADADQPKKKKRKSGHAEEMENRDKSVNK